MYDVCLYVCADMCALCLCVSCVFVIHFRCVNRQNKMSMQVLLLDLYLRTDEGQRQKPQHAEVACLHGNS